MIGRYGPPIFQILRGLSGAYNVALIKTIPKKNLQKDYLYYLLQESHIQSVVTSQSQRSAGQTGVQKEFIERLLIPLPSLDEQKRIAAILNEQMETVEKARQNAIAQLEAAKELTSAYLRDVFNSPEAQKWERKKLRDLAWVSGGIQKTKNRTPQNFHRPYLTVRNVQRGWLDISDIERFEITSNELSRYQLKWGDILIVEGNGSVDHIGRNAIFRGEIEDCIHQNHIIRVRLDIEKVDPEFISLYLNSDIGKTQMIEKAQTTTGLHTLSVSKVEDLEAAIPKLDKQKYIVTTLTEKLTETERLCKTLEQQLETINKLPAAFLRQALNGEL
ncbi:restriction endonuclease subunit S [Dolichospermum flos-aquae UHCC 0037]|uniref:Restriction endonuclease subunit S n=2 Tax=Cyanophyceae TaxID=3028117 RepID=A0ACC7S3C2_DOLFA|nr:restriction endonuclease subunit S [Anabaena sp. 54]MBO1066427.1 restriction endonuclease subunit S [Anabaena sp. 54]MTJ42988.1 restriction endonuclease subunit S [Dolichospermum flos-aquae UHCC 0037]